MPGLAVADHAPAGANDRDTQTVEHRPQAVGLAVHTSPRFAHAAYVTNDALAVWAILQLQQQVLAGCVLFIFFTPVPDITLPLEHLGNAALDGCGQTDGLIDERIGRHFTRMRLAFRNALQHGIEQGELAAPLDVEAYAEYLVGIAVGSLAYLRAKLPLDALRRFLAVALSSLD